MAAQRTEHYTQESNETLNPPTSLPLQPRGTHDNEPTDTADEDAEEERQVLALFDSAFTEEFGYAPAELSASSSKQAAHYINDFTHYLASEYILQSSNAQSESPLVPTLIPKESIERRIGWYYDAFGTNRRTKGPVALRDELEFLKRKNAVVGRIYPKGVEAEVYRTDLFPQLRFGMELEYALRMRGDELAADCAETVLAAHGDRILGLAVTAGRQAMAARQSRRDNHNIVHWQEEDIPIDVRAEKPRGARRPKAQQ